MHVLSIRNSKNVSVDNHRLRAITHPGSESMKTRKAILVPRTLLHTMIVGESMASVGLHAECANTFGARYE